MKRVASLALATSAAGAVSLVYLGLVNGSLPIDIGVGRRTRQLRSMSVLIEADRTSVFDLLESPYLARQTRAAADKIEILERGENMVLAAHRTPVRGRLVAVTVETVRFDRPHTVDFRLVRGPVPHVVERFVLSDQGGGTRLDYHGELGTDLWALGSWWGDRVAQLWERTVESTLEAVKLEAERRRAHPPRRREPPSTPPS